MTGFTRMDADTITSCIITGDAAVSLIVAKSEGFLDKDKYYERYYN